MLIGFVLELLGLFGFLLSLCITGLFSDLLSSLRSFYDLFTVFIRTFLFLLDFFLHLFELFDLSPSALFDLIDCLLRVRAFKRVDLSRQSCILEVFGVIVQVTLVESIVRVE